MLPNEQRNFTFDTVDGIARQTSLPQVSVVFADAMAKLGFNFLGINGLPPQDDGANPVVLTERAPDGFRDCYIHERFYPFDHIASHTRTTFEPFRFSDAPYDASALRGNERYMQALRSFGMGQGLIVPLGRPIDIPAGVWLAGEEPVLDDNAVRAVQLIALFAASKAMTLARPLREVGPALTAREREVLSWAARGKSAWEIGQILHIAKRTVDEHSQTAARKLGAANKTQAVALALLRNIIEI